MLSDETNHREVFPVLGLVLTTNVLQDCFEHTSFLRNVYKIVMYSCLEDETTIRRVDI